MIAIRNGLVYAEGGMVKTDILVHGGVVKEAGEGFSAPGAVELDASGCWVGPGFVDIHVHFREPGQTWKEDIESGSRAAAAGGFTSVVVMPNTDPAIDGPKTALTVMQRADEVALVDVAIGGALTLDRKGLAPAPFDELYEIGVRLFTDDGDSVTDGGLLAEIMVELGKLPGAFVAQHAEDHSRTRHGHMHEGSVASRLNIAGLSSESESDVVARDLELVEKTGIRYHCQHVSSHQTVELIRRAKKAALPVTAEVAPHHLSFVDDDVSGLDPNFKMYPPLRSKDDRSALREALRDGTIDLVATDHAPHTQQEKLVGFADAPRGVIGLETAAAAVNEVLDDPMRLFEAMSVVPADLMGMSRQGRSVGEGRPANLVVFNPNSEWIPTSFASKSSNSPYVGKTMRGTIEATIYEGRLSYRGRRI
jgi:dihydroorotase